MAVVPGANLARFRGQGVWLLLGVVAGIAALSAPAFAEWGNLSNVLRQASVLGLLAIGQTFVVAAGMIDLSVGLNAGLVVVLACSMSADGWSMLSVTLAMLMLAMTVGLLNGLLVTQLGVDSLIATFGMLSILQGTIFTITDRSVGSAGEALKWLADADIHGLPVSAIFLAAVAAIAHLVFARTRFGHHLLAVGGNVDAARRVGIPVVRIRNGCFLMAGLFAGAGGLLLAGRLGTGYPLAGVGLELDSIVAVVLGGTALAGGRGSVIRSLAGVLVLVIVSNAMNLLGISAFVQTFVKGLIVMLAILANRGSVRYR